MRVYVPGRRRNSSSKYRYHTREDCPRGKLIARPLWKDLHHAQLAGFKECSNCVKLSVYGSKTNPKPAPPLLPRRFYSYEQQQREWMESASPSLYLMNIIEQELTA